MKKYTEQDILSQEILKKNSYIDLNKQLNLATFIHSKVDEIHSSMYWKSIPTNNQLKFVCELIWEYFVNSKKKYGITSGKQLHFRINQFRYAKNIKNFIADVIKTDRNVLDVNEAIELAFNIQRYWINFKKI